MGVLKTQEEIVKSRYIRNYILIKEKAPSLFVALNNKENVDWSIKVGQDGSLNAVINGQVLYPADPVAVAEKQLELFKKDPPRLIILYTANIDPNPQYMHFKLQNRILENVDLSNLNRKFPFDGKTIPLIIVFGMGFGYHIIKLIREFDIQHMIVIEPTGVFLNLSLYSIEWKEIFEYFGNDRRKRSFNVIVSDDVEAIKKELGKIIMAINPSYIVNTFLFEHFSSPFFEDVIEHLKTEHVVNPHMWGTIDSELSTLKHALGAVNYKLPIYYGNKPLDDDVPVFIVGNGPSLDNLYDVIKAFSEKALIVSCGTAIKSLYRSGIKPDIHIVADWQDINYELAKEIEDFLRDVYILGAIISHPGIPKLGKKGGVFLSGKANVGSIIFPDYIARLEYSIPTVVATAVSLLSHMGFRRFYLLGVDLGSKSPAIHHSLKSDYHTPGSKLYNFKEFGFNMEVEGNFGGKVYTNEVLIHTKKNLEKLINKFSLDVYNLSDGSKIEGSKPMRPDQLSLNKSLNKEKIIRRIFQNFKKSYLKDMNPQLIVENMVEDIEAYMKAVFPKLKSVKDLKSLIELFSDLHFTLISIGLRRGDMNRYPLFYLIGSSLYKYEMLILTLAFGLREKNLISVLSERFISVIREYLKVAKSELENLLKSTSK